MRTFTLHQENQSGSHKKKSVMIKIPENLTMKTRLLVCSKESRVNPSPEDLNPHNPRRLPARQAGSLGYICKNDSKSEGLEHLTQSDYGDAVSLQFR